MTKHSKFIISLHWTILIVFLINPDILLAVNEPSFNSKSTGIGYILFVFMVLIIIIILIIVLIRFLAHKNRGWMANRAIKSLSGLHLGQNKSLQVVEIGRSLYIIGLGENVELIEKIEDEDEINYIKQSLDSPKSMFGYGNFTQMSDVFINLKNKFMNRSSNHYDDETPLSFQEVFNNKMNQISSRKKRVQELLAEEKSKERSKNDE